MFFTKGKKGDINPMNPKNYFGKTIVYRSPFPKKSIFQDGGSMSQFFLGKSPSDKFGEPQPQQHPWIFERRKRLTQQQPNQGFGFFGQNQGGLGSPNQKVSGVRQKIDKIVKIIWNDVCNNHTSSFCFKEDKNRNILKEFALRYAQLKDIPIELKAILYLVQSYNVPGDGLKKTFIKTIKNVDLASKNPAVKRVLTDYFDTKTGEIMAKEKGKTLQQPMRMVTQTREMDLAKKKLKEYEDEAVEYRKEKKYKKNPLYKTAIENMNKIKSKITNLENNFDYIPLQNKNPKENLKINNKFKNPLFNYKIS